MRIVKEQAAAGFGIAEVKWPVLRFFSQGLVEKTFGTTLV